MTTATVHITPFHVGWQVRSEAPGRGTRDAITGERSRAIEIARHQANRLGAARVVIHHEDGTVDEEFAAT